MRVLLAIITLPTTCLSAMAQNTFTGDHLPTANWVSESHIGQTEINDGIFTPPDSEAQVWDFTDVLDSPNYEMQLFQEPEGLPGADFFPEATTGYELLSIDTAIFSTSSFLQKTDTGLYQTGFYSAINNPDLSIISTTVSTYSGYPWIPADFTYGWSQTEQTRGDAIQVEDNAGELFAIRSIRNQELFLECDAWGTMSTPVYPDGVEVLRVKFQWGAEIIDSIFVDPTNTGLGEWELTDVNTTTLENPITWHLFLQTDSVNPMVAQVFQLEELATIIYFGAIPNGVEEFELEELSLFPNPVSTGVVQVNLGQDHYEYLKVMSMDGKILFEKGIRGESNISLNTLSFQSGLYIVQVYDKSGALRARSKLIKTR